MRTVFLLLSLASLALTATACARPDTPSVTDVPADPAVAVTADPGAAAGRTFENDDFILTIPAGWGMSMDGSEYFDLGTVESITFYDNPLRSDAGAFLTVSTDALEAGEDLEGRANAAYSVQMTTIEDLVLRTYEQGGLVGIEATYHQIDALVYQLYGLTHDEIKIVEGST